MTTRFFPAAKSPLKMRPLFHEDQLGRGTREPP